MTERLHFHFSLKSIGEGNGNPLQCSCLENPRDGGAWWAAVYEVTQSWSRPTWLSSSTAEYTIHFQVKVISKLPRSYDYNPPESYLFTCSILIIFCLIAVKYFSTFSFQSNYINPFLKWPQAHKYYIMI